MTIAVDMGRKATKTNKQTFLGMIFSASVDNHIPRDDIFDYHPSRKCNIYFIIPNRTLDPIRKSFFYSIDLSW